MTYSIITINYNNCNGLRRTIESIINQSFRDFEYIVIDGGSTDGSLEVIKKYTDKITYWVSEPDNGVYNAMNKGIRLAKGDYLNFMNSGDTLYDETVLESIATELADTDILVGKDYHYDIVNNKGFESILPLRISMITFFKSTLPHQGAFIKRTLFNKTLYNENLHIAADWEFYVKKIILDNCHVKLTPRIVSQREQGGISSSQSDIQKKEREDFLHQILPHGVYRDYQTLSLLDQSTLYKLFHLCESTKTNKILTLCIKILYRLYLKKQFLLPPVNTSSTVSSS